MEYPKLVNWAKIRKTENGEYLIKDFLYEDEYSISPSEVHFVLQLDGKTDPYEIDTPMSKQEVSDFLEVLDNLCFLREGRFVSKSFSEVVYTLWIPRITRKLRIASKILNGLLRLTWLPMLIISLIMFTEAEIDDNLIHLIMGLPFGLISGMVMHELGHMFACLAYGGMVFEAGILLKWMMPGAYVMIETSNINVRMHRIQINAAGVKMNFLLTGIFGIIACCFYDYSAFFAAAAGNNLALGALNLMLIDGVDGINIMSELLGIEEFAYKAKKALKNRKYRKMLVHKGVSGKATVTACVVICIAQISLPIIIAINILGVFGWAM